MLINVVAGTIQLVKKVTDTALVVKNSKINKVAKFAISKIKPPVQASVYFKGRRFFIAEEIYTS